ncbi:MAG: S8 family serine peptidase [Lachnospiraceae bacterium]|nr:S8 family serine peptidase [Lachnospiraceae bacterium]
MALGHFWTSILALVLVIAETPVFAAGVREKAPEIKITGEYVPGEAIICIQPDKADEQKIAARSAGLFSTAPEIESGFLMDVSEAAEAFSKEEKGDAYVQGIQSEKTVLKFVKSDSLSTEELIRLYSDKPGVLFAEPNYIVSTDGEEKGGIVRGEADNEAILDLTEYQYSFGEGSGGIDVPGWNDSENINSEGVVVAVLDTGVDYTHPDLAPVMWDKGLEIPELKDGKLEKLDTPVISDGDVAVYNGKMVYIDGSDPGLLVINDGEGGIEKKKFTLVKGSADIPEGDEWILDPGVGDEENIDIYYDGKNLLLFRNIKKYDSFSCVAVYSLDPLTGKGAYIGKLKNSYSNEDLVIAHEERDGKDNLIYIIGYGLNEEGIYQKFIAERFTVKDFKPEILDSAAPEGFEFPSSAGRWTGCGVEDGIYLTGSHNVDRGDNGIDSKRQIIGTYIFSSTSLESNGKNVAIQM